MSRVMRYIVVLMVALGAAGTLRAQQSLYRIRLQDAFSHVLTLDGPSAGFGANWTLRLPSNVSSAGSLLYASDGAGQLSWLAPGSNTQVLTLVGGVPTWAAPATSGTVTSIGMTVPSFLSVSPSTITSSGTFAVTLANESANTVFAGPTTGVAAAPTFRQLALADLPGTGAITVTGGTGLGVSGSPVSLGGTVTLSNTGVTSNVAGTGISVSGATGAVTITNTGVTSLAFTGGTLYGNIASATGAVTLAPTLNSQTANYVFAGPTTGSPAAPTFRQLVAADIPSLSATDWVLAGNAPTAGYNGTTGSFLGTTNTQPLVLATTNTTTAQPIELFTNNTERMRVAATGEVGIGLTPTAGQLLHVNGTGGTSNVRFASLSSAMVSSTGGVLFADATGNLNRLATPASGTQMLTSTATGVLAWATPTTGTVTSVGLSMPSGFSVANSPVTTNGTLTVTTALSGVVHASGGAFTAGNVALGSEVSGLLPAANGGTGLNTSATTTGSILYTSGVGTWATLPAGTNTNVLTLVGGVPTWAAPATSGTVTSVGLSMPTGFTVTNSPVTSSGTLTVSTTLNGPLRGNGSGFTTGNINLASEVSGLLPAANGGTGLNTSATTTGSILYTSGVGTWATLPAGTNTNVLTLVGGVPTWAAPATSGTVTSIGMTVPSFLSVSPSTITSNGTFAVTLASESANSVFAAPNGSAGTPSFRSLVGADVGGFTTGSVIFAGSTGTLSQNNSNFFWDNTNNRLGIGTTAPAVSLDVNGGMVNRETSVAVATNAATIPSNTSQVQLTGAATGTVAITGPTTPPTGQHLIVYNNTTGGFGATLNGYTIPNGQAIEFTYSNSGWRSVIGTAAPATGTVSSVALSMPSIFTVSGSPVTGSGTLTATLASQTQNLVFASPNGSSGTPSFRQLALADLPGTGAITVTGGTGLGVSGSPVSLGGTVTLSNTGVTSNVAGTGISVSGATGAVTITNTGVTSLAFTGGTLYGNIASATGAVTLAPTLNTQTANYVFAGPTTGSPAAPTFRQLVAADIPNLGSSYIQNQTGLQSSSNFHISGNGQIEGNLQIKGTSTGFTTFTGGAQGATTINYTLPTAAPTVSGQVLSSTTAGVMSWVNGAGTVTSVGLSMPSIFTVTNSPVTGTGTLTATLASQSANAVFAAPNGSSGSPTFRSLVGADVTGFTTGSVIFAGSTGALAQDNAAFFWDDANNRLGIGSATPATSLDVVKDYATREYNYSTSLSGSSNDVNFDAAGNKFGFLHLASATAAFTFTGIAGPANGKRISIYNATSYPMTLANQSSSTTTAADRIVTGTGANLVVGAGGTVDLIYSATDQRWIVANSKVGSGASTFAVQFNPTNPTGTANATATAMGLSRQSTPVQYTPTRSGTIMIVVSASENNNSGGNGGQMQIYYGSGSGTGPTNSTNPMVGTAVGNLAQGAPSDPNGNNAAQHDETIPMTCNAVITGLSVGTTYWFDLGVAVLGGAGTTSLYGISVSIIEL